MFGALPRAGLAGPAILVVAGVLLPYAVGSYVLYTVNSLLVYAVLALGLDLLVGRSGQFAFSHIAFFGIGAYGTAFAQLRFGIPAPVGASIAAALAAGIGVLIAIPAARLRHIYLALATFGFAQAALWVFQNWLSVTGGPDGLRLQPADLFGFPVSSDARSTLVLSIVTAAVLLASLMLERSKLGRAFAAIRDSEHVAAVSGIDVRRTKIAAFATSGVYASVAGSMLTMNASFISPENFNSASVILLLSMLVVGGLGSIPGTLLGVAVIGLLPDVLRSAARGFLIWQEFIYGAVLLLSITLMPRGIYGVVRDAIRRARA